MYNDYTTKRTGCQCHCLGKSGFRDPIDCCLLFVRKRGVLQRLDVIENLRRLGRADQNARYDSVAQDPAERHFGERLSAPGGNLVEGFDLLQALFGQIFRMQEAGVFFDAAVGRDAVQIPVGQHTLRQRAERDDALLQLRGGFLQTVMFDRPVEDGVAVLVEDERAVQVA